MTVKKGRGTNQSQLKDKKIGIKRLRNRLLKESKCIFKNQSVFLAIPNDSLSLYKWMYKEILVRYVTVTSKVTKLEADHMKA